MRRSTDRSEQVQLLRSGDAVSWEGLYTRMYQSMVSYASRRLPAEEARDGQRRSSRGVSALHRSAAGGTEVRIGRGRGEDGPQPMGAGRRVPPRVWGRGWWPVGRSGHQQFAGSAPFLHQDAAAQEDGPIPRG